MFLDLPFPGSTARSSSAAERSGAPPRWPRRKVGGRGPETSGRSSTSHPSAEEKRPTKIRRRRRKKTSRNLIMTNSDGVQEMTSSRLWAESCRTNRKHTESDYHEKCRSASTGGRWCFVSTNHFIAIPNICAHWNSCTHLSARQKICKSI